MAIHLRDVGIIRCATPDDAVALSRLMAAHGTEALPLTAPDLDAWRARGPLLVVELKDGTLGGIAHFAHEPGALRDAQDAGAKAVTRSSTFRYIAVPPARNRSELDPYAFAGLRAGAGARGAHGARDAMTLANLLAELPSETTAGELRALRREVARRISLFTMMMLSAPGVVLGATSHPASLAVFLWSTLALIRALRESRIPRAIVWRDLGAHRLDRNQT